LTLSSFPPPFRSYVTSYLSLLRTHELLGDNRLKFAAQLTEMSEELTTLGKEVEKHRRSSKDLGTRLEKGLAEQEGLVDKVSRFGGADGESALTFPRLLSLLRSSSPCASATPSSFDLLFTHPTRSPRSPPAPTQARARFDTAAEELERLLILKQGESVKDVSVPHSSSLSAGPNKRSFGKAMSKLKGPKNAQQIAKQEDEVRSRMGQCSDAYRSQVLGAQAVRQEYFGLQLPRILRVSLVASASLFYVGLG
jgi:Rho GTPase-activating protein RGD1